MLWSKCTFYLLDKINENALVLVTEDRLADPQEVWQGLLLIRAYEMLRPNGIYMVPIIAPLNDETLPAGIPQLSQVLGIEEAPTTYPKLYVINAREGTAVEYPGPLDDISMISPELLMLWSRRTILYQDIKYIKTKVNELNDDYEGDAQQAVDYVEVLKQLKEELKIVKKVHDEVKEALK